MVNISELRMFVYNNILKYKYVYIYIFFFVFEEVFGTFYKGLKQLHQVLVIKTLQGIKQQREEKM